jgi:hypothetical protein
MRACVAGLEVLMLYTLIRCEEEVTCRSQLAWLSAEEREEEEGGTYFQADRTKVGWVLFELSQARTQSSTQPSASTGRLIFQSLQAW